MIGEQNSQDGTKNVSTKVPVWVADLLNLICASRGTDIYGLLKELYLRGFDGAVITELYRNNFGSVSDLINSCRYIENIIKRIESEKIKL